VAGRLSIVAPRFGELPHGEREALAGGSIEVMPVPNVFEMAVRLIKAARADREAAETEVRPLRLMTAQVGKQRQGVGPLPPG